MIGALPAVMPGGISPEGFAAAAGLDASESSRMLGLLEERGIGEVVDGRHLFDPSDRLSAALMLVEEGAPIDDVAVHLDWRSFEGLAAKILESKGFDVVRNLVMTKPRMEIDVVGTNLGIAVLVDCKHWRRLGAAALRTAVEKQVKRARRYVSGAAPAGNGKEGGDAVALPVIVTLYRDTIGLVDGVPVVPILQFSSFADELYGNMDGLKAIGKGSR